MNQGNNGNSSPGNILPILISSLLAGAIAVVVFLFVSRFQLADIPNVAVPAIVSVPIALLGALGYEKGFRNLERNDYFRSLAGGVGAAIGAVIIMIVS